MCVKNVYIYIYEHIHIFIYISYIYTYIYYDNNLVDNMGYITLWIFPWFFPWLLGPDLPGKSRNHPVVMNDH